MAVVWLVRLSICAYLLLEPVLPLALDGTHGSFGELPSWQPLDNGSLQLEFRTERATCLLLYTDHGDSGDYFELKLVGGSLRLSYNLGHGVQMVNVGRRLNDNQWHRVVLERRQITSTLSVDGRQVTSLAATASREYFFGPAPHTQGVVTTESSGSVFIGGVPQELRLSSLAVPSVVFEPKFIGQIRNLMYSSVDGVQRRQELINSKGVRQNDMDECSVQDPCDNGGLCVSTDTGLSCDCRSTGHFGRYCHQVSVSEMSLNGVQSLTWDTAALGRHAISSTSDTVALLFRTDRADGLLVALESVTEYLVVQLKNGAIVTTVGIEGNSISTEIRPATAKFHNNKWHNITVKRSVNEVIGSGHSACRVTVSVDNEYEQSDSVYGSLVHLSTTRMYIGGTPRLTDSADNTADESQPWPAAVPPPRAPLHHRPNFVGCLRNVIYSSDSLNLDLIHLAATGSELIVETGSPTFACTSDNTLEKATVAADRLIERSVSRSVSFETSEAHLVLPTWTTSDVDSNVGSISFRFRTNQSTGLMFFNSGGRNMADLFAIEMVDGQLWCHIDLGSGAVKLAADRRRRLDDGQWHLVAVKRDGRRGRFGVDGVTADFTTPGTNERLDLEGALYVAGLGGDYELVTPLPAAVWSATLRRGFVGCLQDLMINGVAVDLKLYADRQRRANDGSISDCSARLGSCLFSPCKNGGTCRPQWLGVVCDCIFTSYTGSHCQHEAATVSFDGTQHMILPLRHESHTETDHLTVRFRSYKTSGLLLASTAGNSDRLELALIDGRARLAVRINNTYKSLVSGERLDDGDWHVLRVHRSGRHLQFFVDKNLPVETHMEQQSVVLRVKFVYIGAMSVGVDNNGFGAANLHGQLQHVVLNGRPVLELIDRNTFLSSKNASGTAFQSQPSNRDQHSGATSGEQMINFASSFTHVTVPLGRVAASFSIRFRLRTVEQSALLLFAPGDSGHFVALELAAGRLNYVFELGTGAVRVADTGRRLLSDGQWHSVVLSSRHGRFHSLTVDHHEATVTNVRVDQNIQLGRSLHLGGVPDEMYSTLPAVLRARRGYKGCLASLYLQHEPVDLIELAGNATGGLISPGCSDETAGCHSAVCHNLGVCLEINGSLTCDCSLTSFVGATCDQDSLGYRFGPAAGGHISYVLNSSQRTDRRTDQIALGFVTYSPDATLVRLQSDTHRDFLELKLIESNVYLVYDVGAHVISVSDLGARADDGRYHTVRVTRQGANATLQLDNRPVQYKYPRVSNRSDSDWLLTRARRSSGHQHSVFHGASQVTVGDADDRLLSSQTSATATAGFRGLISGLTVNGKRVLDEVATADSSTGAGSRVALRGVSPIRELPRALKKEYVKRSETSALVDFAPDVAPSSVDQLISATESSGCDDPADFARCHGGISADDDLVSAVYMNVYDDEGQYDSGAAASCDDEDCDPSSGSYPSGRHAVDTVHYSDNFGEYDVSPGHYDVTPGLYDVTSDHAEELSTTKPTTSATIVPSGIATTSSTSATTATTATATTPPPTTTTMIATTTMTTATVSTSTAAAPTVQTTEPSRAAVEPTTHQSWDWWSAETTPTVRYRDSWLDSPSWHTRPPAVAGVTPPPWLAAGPTTTTASSARAGGHLSLDSYHSDAHWPSNHLPVPNLGSPVDTEVGASSSSTQRPLVALTGSFSDDPGEYVATIVGIVAAVLIVVVLALLVALRVQGRPGAAAAGVVAFRKADGGGKVLVAGRLTAASSPLLADAGHELHSAATGGGPPAAAPSYASVKAKKRRDIKEWYV